MMKSMLLLVFDFFRFINFNCQSNIKISDYSPWIKINYCLTFTLTKVRQHGYIGIW